MFWFDGAKAGVGGGDGANGEGCRGNEGNNRNNSYFRSWWSQRIGFNGMRELVEGVFG